MRLHSKAISPKFLETYDQPWWIPVLPCVIKFSSRDILKCINIRDIPRLTLFGSLGYSEMRSEGAGNKTMAQRDIRHDRN